LRADIVRKFADLFSVKRGAALTDSPANNEGKSGMLDTITGVDPDQYRPVSDGGFTKRLRWKIKAGDTAPERLTITPAMAEAMLEWNDRNRPMTRPVVEKYARLMAAGRWRYTGEAIIFSSERLIDGQHRLAACVRSGHAFEALVVYNAPDEAFSFIDVGRARTASDVFAIHGVKNWPLMAAAIKWVVGYESNAMVAAAKSSQDIDHATLYEAFLAHPGLQESAWVGHLFAQNRLSMPSLMVALHYLAARKNRKDADDFFRKVGDGLGFVGKKDPAHRLHKRLTDSAIAQEKLGRKQIAALTIKAWNAHRLGRDVGTLKYAADETFPKVI